MIYYIQYNSINYEHKINMIKCLNKKTCMIVPFLIPVLSVRSSLFQSAYCFAEANVLNFQPRMKLNC